MDLFKSQNIIVRINQPLEELQCTNFLFKASEKIKYYHSHLGTNMLLETQKKKIDDINKKVWFNISFLSNPYEYIHPKITKYHNNESIVNIPKPISRSFYKMWEIMNIFPILPAPLTQDNFLYHSDQPPMDRIKTAHLCEGPGGFIEALIKKRGHIRDEIHGLTLLCVNKNKLFHNTDHINIHYGDINAIDTINAFSEQFVEEKAYIVTADGGFEDEYRENVQEQIHSQLIFSEILTALKIQAIHGRFICKIYDTNTTLTAFMITLLTYFYKKVYLYKPTSSRPVNSEKYLVCLGFIGVPGSIMERLFWIKAKWSVIDKIGLCDQPHQKYVHKIYKTQNNFDYNNISYFNFLYSSQQCQYINFALNSIPCTENLFFLQKIQAIQIDYSIEWCLVNNIPLATKYNKKAENKQYKTVTVCQSIMEYIDTDNSEKLQSHVKSMDCTSIIPFYIYVCLSEKYHLLTYFPTKTLPLTTLVYYLTANQILTLCKNSTLEEQQTMLLPFTKFTLQYLNLLQNQELKDYIMVFCKKPYLQESLLLPVTKYKYAIKAEKYDYIEPLLTDKQLAIKIMKYSLKYNSSLSFVKKIHVMAPSYIFSESELLKSIKYGNYNLFTYIQEKALIALFNKNILNYAIRYDYPIAFIVAIIQSCCKPQHYNIFKLMKRAPSEIEIILDLLNKKNLNQHHIKIHNFINKDNELSIDLLFILYKHNVLQWSIGDLQYLKNNLALTKMKELTGLIASHLYKNR